MPVSEDGLEAPATIVSMETFLKATDPGKAAEIINSVLADHWLFPLMEIRYQKKMH